MEFGDDDDDDEELAEVGAVEVAEKPAPHQVLDYRHWRQNIVPALKDKLIMNQEDIDFRLHEFGNRDILGRENINAKHLFLYLHGIENLEHLQGNIQHVHVNVQYGRKVNDRINVKSEQNLERHSNPKSLNFFCNFKYHINDE